MDVTTRKEAKLAGSNTYFTGKPCANGHLSYRYVQSGSCYECVNGARLSNVKPDAGARIERLRKMADELEEKNAERQAVYDKKESERNTILQNREQRLEAARLEALADQNRKNALLEFKEFKAAVRANYVESVKALLLAYAIMRCPDLTIADLWRSRKAEHGVLYRMLCHEEDHDILVAQITELYNRDSRAEELRLIALNKVGVDI